MSNAEADLYTRLGRIEGKIDIMIPLATRVTKVEGKVSFLFGGLALIGFACGMLVKMQF